MQCCRPKPGQDRARVRDLIGFGISGLINNFGYVVMLSAALDLMPHDTTANFAAIVLLVEILPSFLIQLAAPWVMNRIPYWIRIVSVVVMGVLSFLLPAIFVESLPLKLIGVFFAGVGSGLGEITFLSLSSHYHKDTVSTWSSGTGAAGIAGAYSYLGFRLFLTPRNTLFASCAVPIGMGICYFFVLGPFQDNQESVSEPQEDEQKLLNNNSDNESNKGHDNNQPLTTKRQLQLILSLVPYMLPLSLVYFGEYIINQSISAVLLYPGTTISGLEYRIYQALYQSGVFVSRSSVNFFRIKRLYLPALFQTINMIFLCFVAVFNFLPFYVVFIIIFWEGLLGGSIYVNTFYVVSEVFSGKEKEFCLGAISMSYGFSITMAAVLGIFWGPALARWRTDWDARKH